MGTHSLTGVVVNRILFSLFISQSSFVFFLSFPIRDVLQMVGLTMPGCTIVHRPEEQTDEEAEEPSEQGGGNRKKSKRRFSLRKTRAMAKRDELEKDAEKEAEKDAEKEAEKESGKEGEGAKGTENEEGEDEKDTDGARDETKESTEGQSMLDAVSRGFI